MLYGAELLDLLRTHKKLSLAEIQNLRNIVRSSRANKDKVLSEAMAGCYSCAQRLRTKDIKDMTDECVFCPCCDQPTVVEQQYVFALEAVHNFYVRY